MTAPIIEFDDVQTHFATRAGIVRAVDGVTLSIAPGEVLGLVGESGCGKSTLARTLLQLAPTTAGTVRFAGRTLTGLTAQELGPVRREIQMVFQDPYASLNPRMTVFSALAEPLLVHGLCSRDEVSARVARLMEQVGLAPRFMQKYPHEFSGGQRQRIVIARALALQPKVLVADEPVSALDVSIQAQILNLLAQLRREMNLTLLFIAHDLSVVKHLSDRIAVMYLGKIVELGSALDVIERPRHPYTRALVRSIPVPDPEAPRQHTPLAGDPPSPLAPPVGCRFHPRCPFAVDQCRAQPPPLVSVDAARQAACLRLDEIDAAAVRS